MAGEWTIRKIGSLGRVITGKTPSTADAGNFNGPYPFITIPDLDGRVVIDRAERTLSEKGAEIMRSCLLPPGAVMMSCIATVGKCGITAKPSFTNQQINSVIPNDETDPRFLYYVFTQLGHELEAAGGGGSVYTNVSKSRFAEIDTSIPVDLHEQRAIAHILGTLDDKIELNRRMNETLEAIARGLFKSWFVDFDPVRAKAEGRDPCLPKPIANLFPDSFEDSELGEIPKGWKVGKLGDVLAQRVERCIASSETAARPYVPIDCISPRSLFLTERKSGDEAQSSLTKFYKGDLLFGAMRPYFHKVCIAPFDGTTRTTAFVLIPKAKEDFAFATLLLHHPDTIDYATRHSTGSTIPYAVWVGSLEEMSVIVPPSAVRIAFNMTVRPILDRIPVPHFQSKTLATLRDTLLLKLISGEIRIIEDVGRFHGRSTT